MCVPIGTATLRRISPNLSCPGVWTCTLRFFATSYHNNGSGTWDNDESGISRREMGLTSFGRRTVTRGEKRRLVNGVFTSVANKYDLMNDLMSVGIHRIWKDHFCRKINFPMLDVAYQHVPHPNRTLALERFAILDLAGGTGDIAFGLVDRAIGQIRPQRLRKHHCPHDSSVSESGIKKKRAYVYGGVDLTICDVNFDMLEVGQQRAFQRGIPLRPVIRRHNDRMVPSLLPRPADFGMIGRIGVRWVEANGESLPFPSESFDIVTIAFGIRNFADIVRGVVEAHRVLKPGGKFLCLEFSHVKDPILSAFYDAYSFVTLPLLGRIAAGDADSYQYLTESIRKFPDQDTFAMVLQNAGFRHVSYSSMTSGVVAIHSGFKLA